MKPTLLSAFARRNLPAGISFAVILACSSCQQKNVTAPAPTATPATAPNQPSVSSPQSRETKYIPATGVVVRTDPSFPSVELDHDEIKGIMPAMRMEFYVKDKAMLNGLKAGDKVDFVLEDKAGAEMIVEMKKK
jgi:Cu/Ag efflux protein CusF